jgi:hypothetical protein
MKHINDIPMMFNTTGSTSTSKSENHFLKIGKQDQLILNTLDYGIYNKILKFNLNINFNKLLMLKLNKIGSGDIIDFITRYTGLKKLIVWITNGNCGCEARRVKFNSLFSFYWPSIKFRKVYIEDLHSLKYKDIKNYKKYLSRKAQEMDLPNINLDPADILNLPKVPDKPKQPETPVNKTPTKPLTEPKIKKSCGCSKRKLNT